MDESHNIVLPYSWPKPTTLSGEPIKGTVQRIFHTKVLTFSYEILRFSSKISIRAASEYSAWKSSLPVFWGGTVDFWLLVWMILKNTVLKKKFSTSLCRRPVNGPLSIPFPQKKNLVDNFFSKHSISKGFYFKEV